MESRAPRGLTALEVLAVATATFSLLKPRPVSFPYVLNTCISGGDKLLQPLLLFFFS